MTRMLALAVLLMLPFSVHGVPKTLACKIGLSGGQILSQGRVHAKKEWDERNLVRRAIDYVKSNRPLDAVLTIKPSEITETHLELFDAVETGNVTLSTKEVDLKSGTFTAGLRSVRLVRYHYGLRNIHESLEGKALLAEDLKEGTVASFKISSDSRPYMQGRVIKIVGASLFIYEPLSRRLFRIGRGEILEAKPMIVTESLEDAYWIARDSHSEARWAGGVSSRFQVYPAEDMRFFEKTGRAPDHGWDNRYGHMNGSGHYPTIGVRQMLEIGGYESIRGTMLIEDGTAFGIPGPFVLSLGRPAESFKAKDNGVEVPDLGWIVPFDKIGRFGLSTPYVPLSSNG